MRLFCLKKTLLPLLFAAVFFMSPTSSANDWNCTKAFMELANDYTSAEKFALLKPFEGKEVVMFTRGYVEESGSWSREINVGTIKSVDEKNLRLTPFDDAIDELEMRMDTVVAEQTMLLSDAVGRTATVRYYGDFVNLEEKSITGKFKSASSKGVEIELKDGNVQVIPANKVTENNDWLSFRNVKSSISAPAGDDFAQNFDAAANEEALQSLMDKHLLLKYWMRDENGNWTAESNMGTLRSARNGTVVLDKGWGDTLNVPSAAVDTEFTVPLSQLKGKNVSVMYEKEFASEEKIEVFGRVQSISADDGIEIIDDSGNVTVVSWYQLEGYGVRKLGRSQLGYMRAIAQGREPTNLQKVRYFSGKKIFFIERTRDYSSGGFSDSFMAGRVISTDDDELIVSNLGAEFSFSISKLQNNSIMLFEDLPGTKATVRYQDSDYNAVSITGTIKSFDENKGVEIVDDSGKTHLLSFDEIYEEDGIIIPK